MDNKNIGGNSLPQEQLAAQIQTLFNNYKTIRIEKVKAGLLVEEKVISNHFLGNLLGNILKLANPKVFEQKMEQFKQALQLWEAQHKIKPRPEAEVQQIAALKEQAKTAKKEVHTNLLEELIAQYEAATDAAIAQKLHDQIEQLIGHLEK